MRKFIALTIIALMFLSLNASAFKIKIKTYKDEETCIYLKKYAGLDCITIDSAIVQKGQIQFKNASAITKGIYRIEIAGNSIDFLVSSPEEFSLNCIYKDGNFRYSIKGDTQSRLYDQIQSNNDTTISLSQYKTQLSEEDFLYKILSLKTDENPSLSDDDLIFTTEEYLYAYLNGFCSRIEKQNIIIATQKVKKLISRTESGSKIQQYILKFLMNRFENPKILMFENLYVSIFDQYLTPQPAWMDDYSHYVLKWKVDVLRNNLLDAEAKEINLADKDGNLHSMYSMNAKFKVLFFWDTECDVCTEAAIQLLGQYPRITEHNAEIYAVYTEDETEIWENFITENNITWINVHDPEHIGTFSTDYGTYRTPRIYILNSDNIIIAKDLEPENVAKLLDGIDIKRQIIPQNNVLPPKQ